MCGRFNITDNPSTHALLKSLHIDLGPLPVRYNLAPTDQIPVIHHWEGQRLISDMRWWLVPHWTKSPSTKYAMFNARCESLETSRAYQGSFRHKRCIIPAHSFVEWQRHGLTKHLIFFRQKTRRWHLPASGITGRTGLSTFYPARLSQQMPRQNLNNSIRECPSC